MTTAEYVSRGLGNVAQGEAVAISIAGMLTVFFALGLIAAVIALLPGILRRVSRFLPEPEETGHGGVAPAATEDAAIAAIGYILHRRQTGAA